MQGKIVKGIAGFYYVRVVGSGVCELSCMCNNGPADHFEPNFIEDLFECKAKGVFRKEKVKPLVGDNVEFDILDEAEKTGNITMILPRRNELVRPAVANVDQAMVVFAAAKPKPHLNLLDRFLIMMEQKQIPVIMVFNKKDLAEQEELSVLKEIYEKSGYPVLFTSVPEDENIGEVKKALHGKTTAIAGPSGVGKSSLINVLQEGIRMETGDISRKIERGKHTTRHSELIAIDHASFIFDTPGFSSLYAGEMEKETLKDYYPEFREYEGCCRFQGCDHIHEPGCAVKEALSDGRIHPRRYESYTELYREIKERKRY